MGTATQLDREIVAAHGEDADVVVVFFAEQRHGTFGLGFLDRQHFGLHRGIETDLVVHQFFDGAQLFRLHTLIMGEVETQAAGSHLRAFLLHMGTEHLAQGRVHQVGGRMVQPNGLTQLVVHQGLHRVTYVERTGFEHTDVDMGAALLGGIGHIETRTGGFQRADIAHLSAGFGIERRVVQNDLGLLTCTDALHRLAINEDFGDAPLIGHMLVTAELALGIHIQAVVVVGLEFTGRLGAVFLLFHLTLEPGVIDGQVALAGDIGGQVCREAVGVVQLEHDFAGDLVAGETFQILLENFQPLLQGLGELLFFLQQDFFHLGLGLGQLGIGIAHLAHQRGHQLVEERTFGAQLVAMTDSATQDAAQYITATFVGRHYAIHDQKRAGTDMVSHHTQGFVFQILGISYPRHIFQQVGKQVDFVVAVHMLHDRGNPLQPHAGIHRRLGQRHHGAVGLAIELHEHVVPDFDVAVAVFFWRSRRATPDVRAMVVENLGAGAAGAGVAHLPEVVGGIRCALVVTNADHPLGRHTDFLGPDIVGFVVGRIDGDPQLVGRQFQPLFRRQKFPGKQDRIPLEIIAKAEVAQHFEKGMVTGRVSDIFQIVVLATGTDATLGRNRTSVGTQVAAQKHILELHHARVGEQQGRIITGDQ